MSLACECLLRGEIEVPFRNTDQQRDIVFVGESPGHVELKLGEPFVGPSGKLLRNAIKTAKLDISECAICNSARCLIDKKKLPAKQITEVLKSCRSKLENAIRVMQPKILILLGDIALKQVLKTSGITKKRGKFTFNEEFNCWVIPTFHPAYILRAREMEPYLVEDLRAVKRFIDNDYTLDDSKYDTDYREVRSIRSLLMAIKESEGKVYVALDTETQGLNHNDPDESFLISYSISALANTGYQIFLRELWKEGDPLEDIDRTYIVSDSKNPRILTVKKSFRFREKLIELKELVDNDNVILVMQNGKFDKHHIREEFKRAGLEPPEFTSWKLDLQIAAHVIEENMYKTVSLESLTRTFLQKNDNWKEEFSSAINKNLMIEAPKDKLTAYACEDADNTLQIGLKLGKILSKDERLLRYFRKVAMPICSEALFTIEENGIYVDSMLLPITKEEIRKNVSSLHKKAIDLIPQTILNEHVTKGLKLSRNHFIADVLFNPLGFGEEPVAISSSSGIPMVNSNVRSILKSRSLSDECREFLDTLEEWSETNTLLTKSIKQIEDFVCPDGRLRSNFSNNQAVTGRINSARPNLMNIPKRLASAKHINKLISVPSDEWLLAEADASQCLVPETGIYTIDGIKTLAEVIENKHPVLSLSSEYNFEFKDVVRGWSTGEKEVFEIVLEDGSSVVATGLHKFYDFYGNIRTVSELSVGDRLLHMHLNYMSRQYPEISLSLVRAKGLGGHTNIRIHKVVAQYLNGGKSVSDGCTHHLDKDKNNWHRSNIVVCGSPSEHTRLFHSNGSDNANYGNIKGKPRICPQCGKEFYKPPSKDIEVTCSIKCRDSRRKETGSGRKPRITSICQFCKKEFQRKNYLRPKFCSPSCYISYIKEYGRGNHKIVSIQSKGIRETFQIEVSDNHNYILSNGLISKNSELRCIAHVSRDEEMIRVYKNDEDIHTNTAKSMARGMWDSMSDEEHKSYRTLSKPANFGIVYGMSPNGFVNYCRTSYKLLISHEEAVETINKWFSLYPRVLEYHRRAIDLCKEYGYSASPLGRRRRLPQIHSDDLTLRSAAERMAINSPIQSMSSDMMLISLLEIMKDKRIDKTACFPCLFIHDSLLFQIRKEVVSDYIPIIKHHIEHPPLDKMFGIKLRVPLKADVKIGPNRTDMEEVKDGAE